MTLSPTEPEPSGSHGAYPGRIAALRRARPPAAALVATSAVSVQCGAAIATRLFHQVGPEGALSLRLGFATVALLLVVRPRPSGVRAVLDRPRRQDLAVMVAFGVALAAMNLSFYEALARIPLGVAVTVEFTGPLAVSLVGSRRPSHLVWAVLAGAGVVLLAAGGFAGAVRHLDMAGVGLALLAGCFWAAYIVANKETGRRFPGTSGLAGAMAVAALLVVPVGIATHGAALWRPWVLGIGLAVALLSSALPYSLELVALRHASARAFGVLLSMEPAIAALAGLAILGQRLSFVELGALVLVVAANLGNAWSSGGTSPAGGDHTPGGEARASEDRPPLVAPTLAE